LGCHPVAVHIYTQTIHRTTQITTEQHKYKLMWNASVKSNALFKKSGDTSKASYLSLCKLNNKVLCFVILLISVVAYNKYHLTFRGPCIMIYSYNEGQRDASFLKFI